MNVIRLQTRLHAAGYDCGSIDGFIGPRTYAALFSFVARRDLGSVGLALGRGAAAYFRPASISNELRIAHALGQWAVETGGYTRFVENLNYSADRLRAVWPSRFPTLASAKPYAYAPEKLANKVYGGRLGNSETGDGWRYRGRGPSMLTFRGNYAQAADMTGLKLVENPDLAADPERGIQIACAYWTSRGINEAADADDVALVRWRINGGAIGLTDAKAYTSRAKVILL